MDVAEGILWVLAFFAPLCSVLGLCLSYKFIIGNKKRVADSFKKSTHGWLKVPKWVPKRSYNLYFYFRGTFYLLISLLFIKGSISIWRYLLR